MSRAAASSSAASSSSASALHSKSPAEFFAEHQHIAGFDNPGKSLYTTIREFIENSLDACEAIGVSPLIECRIEKLTQTEFEAMRGVHAHERVDQGLYAPEGGGAGAAAGKKGGKKRKIAEQGLDSSQGAAAAGSADAAAAASSAAAASADSKSHPLYFRVSCRDNGCGIRHDLIPRSFGVVLSSTKYGVKQTRGKFGLGAKMALVWSKKSTGMPIEIRSAVGGATGAPSLISHCTLDIDIQKNEPRVLVHEQLSNAEGWRGTEISVIIGGRWTNYQSKVFMYCRQLAVITPYAHIKLSYEDHERDSKSWRVDFHRRTEVMPPLPKDMKHHPSSVDNLLVEQLIHQCKPKDSTLKHFLRTAFSSISPSLADRIISELQGDFSADLDVHSLSKKQIHEITTLFKKMQFPMPEAKCLSPAGEYNLRLGVMKELNPEMVVTASSSLEVYEGHPFMVEAAVSVGGARAKPGLHVFRFANRIPLLFEPGADVVSVVAHNKIKWSLYKLNQKTDKLCVFVSLVSTKIPFKGTSKEYIGDDHGVLHDCIKKALTNCCQQLRRRLQAQAAVREKADRRKQMSKYIPDVSRSFAQLLHSIKTGVPIDGVADADADAAGEDHASLLPPQPSSKKRRVDGAEGESEAEKHALMVHKLGIQPHEQSSCSALLSAYSASRITESILRDKLHAAVDSKDAELDLMGAEAAAAAGGKDEGAGPSGPFFIGGMDTANMDLQCMHAEDFKITYW